MNRTEARDLVIHCARLYPGKITVDDAVTVTWANALADMTIDQADEALTEHQRTKPRNHVVSPADLWAAHRSLTVTGVPSTRPELATPCIAHEPRTSLADDIAHAELDKARALLRPTTPRRTR